MEKSIILLDLCCKAGGCSMGYYNAAQKLGLPIEIFGVDIETQPNYPFNFIQDDAVDFLQKNGTHFSHVHASPPCQLYSCSTAVAKAQHIEKHGTEKKYSNILLHIQLGMTNTKRPGVIENVYEAPIRPDVVLSGDMFGLKVLKRRKFELVNWFMFNPMRAKVKGTVLNGDYAMVVGNGQLGVKGGKKCTVPGSNIKEQWSNATGIHWMTEYKELAEAIPPAYTEYIGMEFLTRK